MKKVFTDSISSSREPAKFIGSVNGYDCYESDSIYMTHLVRMEKGRKTIFNKELQAKIDALSSSVKPICPYCKTEMFIAKFNGYYDTFQHWDCKCSGKFPDKVKPENISQGMYN